ncbi:endonuclease/exonuclease/phosphatase family protein [Oleiagrimonas sp. C23AA]|uniref:endonuclease/exonuclease/phosphatase family protein n=1 Tax=Oleiagrimonas sp. C23AA TaxID=2719047 RepID=UPI00141F92AB|nr:endonuclease/exonuclease/phosphatase family protein [Oleiagrimonas sp. C23AA]NII11398.1 EEP domain-containing protein [Oleiagrimonas sp. C23AA]
MTDTDDLQTTLKLLSCNILAGASVQRYRQYITRSWASVLPTRAKQANLDKLASELSAFDVVGLQEADAGSLRSGFRNQTQYLADAAGMPYWSHQPNRPVARLAHSSNGLISRHEPTEVLDYPLPGRIPGRGVMLARFGKGREALVVAVAHLSLGPAARDRQLGFIGELLSEHPHAVLMGDLNTEITSPELKRLFARTSLTPPAEPVPTFPSWRPQRAIDHIFTSADIQVLRQWTLAEAFSDHLPLAAEVRIPVRLFAH